MKKGITCQCHRRSRLGMWTWLLVPASAPPHKMEQTFWEVQETSPGMWTAWSTAQFSVCTFCSLALVMLLCTQSSDQSSSKGQCHICVDKGAGKHVPFPHSCDTPRGLTHTNLRYHLVTHFSAGRGDGGQVTGQEIYSSGSPGTCWGSWYNVQKNFPKCGKHTTLWCTKSF